MPINLQQKYNIVNYTGEKNKATQARHISPEEHSVICLKAPHAPHVQLLNFPGVFDVFKK